MAPDSRRSESCGRLFSPVRCSGARDSCESATTGTRSSLRERLEPARDLADLLLPALGVRRALHQLQVVDDDHADVGVRLEAPRLGPHLEQRHARRVVDPDRRVAQDAGGAREPRELVVAQHALAQPLRVDARLRDVSRRCTS